MGTSAGQVVDGGVGGGTASAGGELLLLVNPTSGRGRARRWAEWVRRQLERSGRHAKIVSSVEEAGRADDAAARAREWWLFGGDGTLRRWLQEGAAPGATAALFPAGTGNVVARELAIPLSLRGAFAIARSGAARPFDVGRVNGDRFAFMVSAGFDAAVVHHVARHRRGPMRRIDWVIAMRACKDTDEPPFSVAVDGAPPLEVRYVAIFNCGRYAGGFHACPEARCDDGLFHVLALREPVAPRLLRVAWSFARGSAARLPDARLLTGRRVAIRGAERSQVDGDPGPGGNLDLSLEPGALRIVAPLRRA